jgi:hypothetical protein
MLDQGGGLDVFALPRLIIGKKGLWGCGDEFSGGRKRLYPNFGVGCTIGEILSSFPKDIQ